MALGRSGENQDSGNRDRIDELQAQVKELSGLVELLLSKQESQAVKEEPVVEDARSEAVPHGHHLVDDVRESVGRALGGEEGESLESRVGGIWLSRIVAVLFLTLMVLGSIITLQDETLDGTSKIAIGFSVSAIAIGYGVLRRRSDSFFPQTIMGSGLAAFYFTVYAGFFLENTRIFPYPSLGIFALALTLVAVAVVGHLRRSQTVAGISLFLIYYTVVLSLWTSTTEENAIYALITGSLLATVALVFHLTHRWLLFSWGSLIATQLIYIYFFIVNPPDLGFSDETYFWYSNAFLTLVFCVFSAACITDARKTGEYRRTVAPMAGVNSFVYLALTWVAIREFYPAQEWAFRLGQTGMFLVFMVYAQISGPRRNYLFQIFAAKSFIIFTLALQAFLSHEWLLVAMSLECLALGFSYKRSRLVIFKLLGLGLLFIVFVGCLFTVKMPDEVDVLGYTLPAKWFTCITVPFVLSIAAWFYEHFVRRIPPDQREAKGQWFLADSWVDLSGGATALLHTAAGALILMAITIIDLGHLPALPYILAGEGILMALLGLLLATPQVEVASVLLLIAAHVCYHVFLWLGMEGFETQPNYSLYTYVVVAVTFFGGYLWERYLRRIQGGTQFEHDAMAAIPYLAATTMLVTFLERQPEVLYAPLGQAVLTAALFLVGSITLLVGLRVAGALALGLGTWSFYSAMYDVQAPITRHPDFAIALLAVLICYAASERALALWDRRRRLVTRASKALRTLVVGLASLIGLLALREWAPREQLSFYWLGHAMCAMALGLVFRESRYRWAALTIYAITIVRFLVYDLATLQPALRFIISAALTLPGILMSWGYSEYRERHLRKLRQSREPRASQNTPIDDGPVPHG